MQDNINELIYNLMGGGGHLKQVPLEKAKKCLEFYWKRRGKLKIDRLPIHNRRISELILHCSWNCSNRDLQSIFGVSNATLWRDLDYMKYHIQHDVNLQMKYKDIYTYIVYYGKHFYL